MACRKAVRVQLRNVTEVFRTGLLSKCIIYILNTRKARIFLTAGRFFVRRYLSPLLRFAHKGDDLPRFIDLPLYSAFRMFAHATTLD